MTPKEACAIVDDVANDILGRRSTGADDWHTIPLRAAEQLANAARTLQQALVEAERKGAAVRDALRPFADAAADLDDETHDRSEIWELPCAMSITAGDLRAAAALVN